ncbi:hypothetical protein LOK49_LG05G02086 [Camellia lanceoleosa]|uniref:Uncharacterized protein n=1 Tax=Camellia lanceoleosa TaxID=1840588 RepID=A0ACC0HMM9_9ERIC|nr:hypothetical protein LOK49_LG05G02086 [Camellia lanceoleosa]
MVRWRSDMSICRKLIYIRNLNKRVFLNVGVHGTTRYWRGCYCCWFVKLYGSVSSSHWKLMVLCGSYLQGGYPEPDVFDASNGL